MKGTGNPEGCTRYQVIFFAYIRVFHNFSWQYFKVSSISQYNHEVEVTQKFEQENFNIKIEYSSRLEQWEVG